MQGSSKSAERRAALIISLPLLAAGFLLSPTAFRRSCGEEAARGRESGAGCGERGEFVGLMAPLPLEFCSIFRGLVIRFWGPEGSVLIVCAWLNASKPSRAAGSDRPGASKSSAGSSGLVQQRDWRWGEEGEEKKPRTPAAAVPRAWLGAAPMLGQRLSGPGAEHLPAAVIPLKQGRTKPKEEAGSLLASCSIPLHFSYAGSSTESTGETWQQLVPFPGR